MSEPTPLDPLVSELLAAFPSRDADAVRRLLTELVADWRREAGDDPDADEVIAVLREDLEAALAPLDPAARREHLRAEVLERRLRALSRRTWAAAHSLRDGTMADAEVRAEGRAVLAATEALAPEIRSVRGEAGPSLRQALEDVVLEGLYLAERGAMSARFTALFGPDAAP